MRMSVPRSLTLSTLFNSVCPDLLQEEASLSMTLIYEYKRMSLGVILLLCPFNRTVVVFTVPLGQWSIRS